MCMCVPSQRRRVAVNEPNQRNLGKIHVEVDEMRRSGTRGARRTDTAKHWRCCHGDVKVDERRHSGTRDAHLLSPTAT